MRSGISSKGCLVPKVGNKHLEEDLAEVKDEFRNLKVEV